MASRTGTPAKQTEIGHASGSRRHSTLNPLSRASSDIALRSGVPSKVPVTLPSVTSRATCDDS